MSDWGPSLYGDPCRECGFDWNLSVAEGTRQVAVLPAAFAEALSGASGNERHPDLTWSTSAYVSHVADNLRIWTERLMGWPSVRRPSSAATTRVNWRGPGTTR